MISRARGGGGQENNEFIRIQKTETKRGEINPMMGMIKMKT
jgi:hypothetical protein